MFVQVLLNLLNELGKEKKCETYRAFYRFFFLFFSQLN